MSPQANYAPVVSADKALHDNFDVKSITQMCFDKSHQMVIYSSASELIFLI